MNAELLWRLWLEMGPAPWMQAEADEAEDRALVSWAIAKYERQTGRLNDWTPED